MSSRVLYKNEREVVTQLSPRGVNADVLNSYRHLLLEWTELNQKFEYNLQYNSTRRGFWMTWLHKSKILLILIRIRLKQKIISVRSKQNPLI